MTSTFEPDSWERVAAELQAQREAQKQAWGDIDSATLGRYLADEISAEERRHVEQALADRPELRQLTDLVRGVLNEFEPVAGPVAATVPASPPQMLPFPTPGTRSPARSKWFGPRFRQRSALVAAACLLLVLGLTLHGPGNPDAALPMFTNLERAEARRITPGKEGAELAVAVKPFAAETLPAGAPLAEGHANLPPAMQLHEAERQAQALEVQGRIEEALARREKQLPLLAKRANLSDAAAFEAGNCNRIGQLYQARGDLGQAESSYVKARDIAENKLGRNHPSANQAELGLAQTYAAALDASADSSSTRFAVSSSVGTISPASIEGRKPEERRGLSVMQRNAALTLASSILSKHPGEVRMVVVPTLLLGLRQCTTPEERRTYIQALARLGPAAREAVPVLEEILKRSRESAEQQAVVQALGQLGPTAGRAVPLLVEATRFSCPQVNRRAAEALLNCGPEGLIALRGLKEKGEGKQKQLAFDTLQQTSPREACVGIKDPCELFTVQTVTETQNDLLSLARAGGTPIYVETVDNPTDKSMARDGAAQALLSVESVYLRMHKAPPWVEIRVPETLRQRNLSQARQNELRALVERHLKAKEYDQALRAVARFLAEKTGK